MATETAGRSLPKRDKITQNATPKAYATGQCEVLLQSAARNQNL